MPGIIPGKDTEGFQYIKRLDKTRRGKNMVAIRDKCAIVGIGETEYSRNSGRSEMRLAVEAVKAAVDDAGLRMRDIDGLMKFSVDTTGNVGEIATNFGISNLRFHAEVGFGGSAACALIGHAAMAIANGMATNVVCFRALNGRSGYRWGEFTRGEDIEPAIGFQTEPNHWAMWCRRHMYEYGTTSAQLGTVAVAFRRNACLNPRAIMHGKPITLEDYFNSRMIVDPFHVLDITPEIDGACAVVVTSSERAEDLRQRPVYILGAAQGTKPAPASWFCMPDFAESPLKHVVPPLFAKLGLAAKDIDVAQIYDCFTFTAIAALEACGFCKIGEGGPFVEGGRIELGGEIPLNTAGGLLSEGYMHGMNNIVEAVRQLRGTSTAQVKEAEIELVTAGGVAYSVPSALVLRR